MKRKLIITIGVTLIAVFVVFVVGHILGNDDARASGQASQVSPKTYFLQTITDQNGRFELKNIRNSAGISREETIAGVTVAIQNKSNSAWYIIHNSHGVTSRISWGYEHIAGFIEHRDYANQPARILIFTVR